MANFIQMWTTKRIKMSKGTMGTKLCFISVQDVSALINNEDIDYQVQHTQEHRTRPDLVLHSLTTFLLMNINA